VALPGSGFADFMGMTTSLGLESDARSRSTRQRVLLLAILIAASASFSSGATQQQIDTQLSTITVRVFKTGLFRGFGDNHEILGTVKSGSINETDPAEVHIAVSAQNLRVVDSDASAHDRAQVQMRMLGPEVLDAGRFQEIRFDSEKAELAPSGNWLVHGRLTLHGQTRALTVSVIREQGHYRGSATLKQTDFGISPISIAGGAVKVKDELKIDFDIVTKGGTTY
jgi:polyisoprenoid-binding protein YceI